MDQQGSLAGFLLSKLGMAFAVIVLLGSVFMMHLSFERATQREKLEVIARTVADELCMIDGMPGEAQIERELPVLEQRFELVIIGVAGEGQIIRVIAVGTENVECDVALLNQVNRGGFVLRCENPVKVRLIKNEQIFMEVV